MATAGQSKVTIRFRLAPPATKLGGGRVEAWSLWLLQTPTAAEQPRRQRRRHNNPWRRQHRVQPPTSQFPSLPLFSTDGGAMATTATGEASAATAMDGDDAVTA
ncbi:hypothetical protein PIB30_010372 [Stylosanthes scabra]|uniref:Uncharacterized protein n=1 Tax=Stylosanthes scabra TaxID=79078 RepID=A0ABU6W3G8_9FABA|nr:hypothetical protein [Stylosanthes scabra]